MRLLPISSPSGPASPVPVIFLSEKSNQGVGDQMEDKTRFGGAYNVRHWGRGVSLSRKATQNHSYQTWHKGEAEFLHSRAP